MNRMVENGALYISCSICGRYLLKCQGQCSIELTCNKCNKKMLVFVENKKIVVMEAESALETK